MNRSLAFAAVLCSLLLTSACSEEIEEVCQKMEECSFGITEDTCLQRLRPYEFTPDCMERMRYASCEDHRTLSYWDDCWEMCSQPVQECTGDQIQVCEEGYLITMDCARGCDSLELPYEGVCGVVSANGEISDKGEVCWCVVHQ